MCKGRKPGVTSVREGSNVVVITLPFGDTREFNFNSPIPVPDPNPVPSDPNPTPVPVVELEIIKAAVGRLEVSKL